MLVNQTSLSECFMLVPTLKQQTVENNVQRLLTSASYYRDGYRISKTRLKVYFFCGSKTRYLSESIQSFSIQCYSVRSSFLTIEVLTDVYRKPLLEHRLIKICVGHNSVTSSRVTPKCHLL